MHVEGNLLREAFNKNPVASLEPRKPFLQLLVPAAIMMSCRSSELFPSRSAIGSITFEP